MSSTTNKDQWTSEVRNKDHTCNESTQNELISDTCSTHQAYSASASFVPKLTQTLLRYLAPQPTDKALDVGCGDGKFTENFLPAVTSVLGIDASLAMIDSAKKDYSSPKTEFRVVDCRYLEKEGTIVDGSWDRV